MFLLIALLLHPFGDMFWDLERFVAKSLAFAGRGFLPCVHSHAVM
jgi:hypothetical protein